MPMIHPCSAEGCSVLTMGELCLEHERRHAQGDAYGATDLHGPAGGPLPGVPRHAGPQAHE